jgi:hypothetical protein
MLPNIVAIRPSERKHGREVGGILQNGPAALPHYRVIVDQQNAGH